MSMISQNQTQVKLSELIAPSFYALHWDIAEHRHTHYKLSGGRGSTKSSFVSAEVILGMMQDPKANAIAMRKVGRFLEESVFQQLIEPLFMGEIQLDLSVPVTFEISIFITGVILAS